MTLKLAPLLNVEVLRVTKAENITDDESMKKFMDELAVLCGVGTRQVYRWRSGSAPLPAEHVPTLCTRFGSNALLDELSRANGTQIEVPDRYELAQIACEAVREDLDGYQRFLIDFEDGIQPGEIEELRECAARIHRNVHVMLGIAEADCARRQAAPPRKGSAKSDVRGQRSETRKTGTR
jgi:hypothetical protein